MLIKLFSRFKVVDAKGPIMDQSELVTYLNDICIIAPGAFVEAPIIWKTIDEHSVKASITQFGHTISAILYFNEKYEFLLLSFMLVGAPPELFLATHTSDINLSSEQLATFLAKVFHKVLME